MAASPIPLADLLAMPLLIARSARAHRATGTRPADFRLVLPWKPGPSAEVGGPVMISLTQYTPHHRRDLPAIWRAAEELGELLVGIEAACGVLTYLQPARRRAGSLSIWAEEAGLAEFVGLARHREIMDRYRSRGLPLRSAKWFAERPDPSEALAHGQALLDASAERRVIASPD